MTEDEWLAATDPLLMLEFVRDQVSERELRLYACSWFYDKARWGRVAEIVAVSVVSNSV